MTTSRRYTSIVPRLDRTGPTNVAVDLCKAAQRAGWEVRLLYLSGTPQRDDCAGFSEVRPFKARDLLGLSGVVHTHCLRPDLLGGLISLNPRCTLVTTLHNYFLIDLGFDHARWKVRLAWRLWRFALGRFDHRVSISGAMRRYYSRTLPRLRFETVYNFCNEAVRGTRMPDVLDEWLPRQRAQGRTVLAYVGGLNPRKNVGALLQGLAERPGVALAVCGEGPLAGTLRQQAAELGLGERVLFLGQVRSPQAVVGRADALVLPSRAEGMPLVALEAMAAGKPCLLSNIAVHRELAAAGIGMTFDHRRLCDFDAKLDQLLSRPAAAEAERLRSLWSEKFTSDRGFEAYRRLWEPAAVEASR